MKERPVMPANELKPCPFCGGSARVVDSSYSGSANEIISRLSIAGSTPDSVASLLRCAGYNGMTGKAIRQRLIKLEKEKAVEKVRRPGIRSACWAPITK